MKDDPLELLKASALQDMRRRFEAYRQDLPLTLKESLGLANKVRRWRFVAPEIMGNLLPGGVKAIWASDQFSVWPEWSEAPFIVVQDATVESIPSPPPRPVPEPDNGHDSHGKWVGEEGMADDGPCIVAEVEEEYVPPREPQSALEILFGLAEKAGAFALYDNVVTELKPNEQP